MLYQLPDGTTIEISLDEYLSMDDDTFRVRASSKNYFYSVNVGLGGYEYNGEKGRKERDYDDSLDVIGDNDNEVYTISNKSIRQIVDEMPEDEVSE